MSTYICIHRLTSLFNEVNSGTGFTVCLCVGVLFLRLICATIRHFKLCHEVRFENVNKLHAERSQRRRQLRLAQPKVSLSPNFDHELGRHLALYHAKIMRAHFTAAAVVAAMICGKSRAGGGLCIM